MPLSHNEVLDNSRTLLKNIPFRTKFERENFLYGSASGPRLLVVLCQEIEGLNNLFSQTDNVDEQQSLLDEMNVITDKINELKAEVGDDIATALEEAESDFWVETLARKAAIEALTQKFSFENMEQMLKMPAELYEETITKCQSFLNVINKTTRSAERKANVANVPTDGE